jgi:hypothetical protein
MKSTADATFVEQIFAAVTASAGLTLLCVACATDVARDVAVEPAPVPGAVEFVLKDRTLVYGLTVMTCNGRAVWTISNTSQGMAPSRIVYGVTPNGFTARVGPEQPLKPGCYEVVVSGPSRVRFEIAPDGRLVAPVGGAS